MKYSNALSLATIWMQKLQPYCNRIEIAGGLRRKKQDVHDIEIVALPKTVVQTDLFLTETKSRHPGFAETLQDVNELAVVKGDAHRGRYTQVHLRHHDIDIDVFIADERNFGLQKLIRTGDWEFSKKFLGSILRRHGYRSEDGYLREDTKIIPVAEEEELFRLCRIPFIKPEHRNLNALPV